MIKVAIVGTGTVSKHLEEAFENATNVNMLQVLPSRTKAMEDWVTRQHNRTETEIADIYIIAVSDDAVSSVSKHFINSRALLVHTSGSVVMTALPKGVRKGVFYPLQTFSKGRTIAFDTLPICIEAERPDDLALLRTLALSISESVYEIQSEQRRALHLAAVFVNNFTNHLFHIGHDLCAQHQVSFEILKPLIKETVAKIEDLDPLAAQTGPALRDDQATLAAHLQHLTNTTHEQVYRILTKSIQETHANKL